MRSENSVFLWCVVAMLLSGCNKTPQPMPDKENVVEEPTGALVICGQLVLNKQPMVGVPVSYSYSWKPGVKGCREISATSDVAGAFVISNLPAVHGALTWEHVSGYRKMGRILEVVPPSIVDMNVDASSTIVGTVVSSNGVSVAPRGIKIVRIMPGLRLLRYEDRVDDSEFAKDLQFADSTLSTNGLFSFQELPSGTYAVSAPGRFGRGPDVPALFKPVIVSVDQGETKTLSITCP